MTTQDISRFLYPTLVTFLVACTCHDWGVVVVMAGGGGHPPISSEIHSLCITVMHLSM